MIARLFFLFAIFTSAATTLAADSPFETPDHSRNAFGNPFPKLDREERREFFFGNNFFKEKWVQQGSSTTARDGLGPTFNAVSCSACHLLDGRGMGAAREGVAHLSLLFRLDGTDDLYGAQLNPYALPGISGEGQAYISFQTSAGTFPDGETFELRMPIYNLTDWMFGRPQGHTRVSPRVANQTIGLGLLEAIPAAEIEAQADPADKNGDGISGRVTYVLNLRTGAMELGRFGWKSEQPTVEQQSAAAFNGDMGLTSTLFPNQNCPAPQLACQGAPHGVEVEVSDHILSRVALYMKSLAVPTRRLLPDDRGEKTFTKIGCANCHRPSYTVEGVAVYPFTDMLLHDMGPDLADRNLDGGIMPTEWRTPPLWGTGLSETVNRHTNLMHDGRARNVQEAILWHGGEGRASAEAYKNLNRDERQALVDFVNSL